MCEHVGVPICLSVCSSLGYIRFPRLHTSDFCGSQVQMDIHLEPATPTCMDNQCHLFLPHTPHTHLHPHVHTPHPHTLTSLTPLHSHLHIPPHMLVTHCHTHTHTTHTTCTLTSPHSTITTLCSRVDKLEAELSSYSSVRTRQSSRQIKHVESERTPQYQRKATSAVDIKRLSTDSISSITSVNHTLSDTPFPWHMPFTVKCVGTFR